MRIAICFSGMIRTGVLAHTNIKNFIGDLWDTCDFFVHTWDLDYQSPMYGETWKHYNEYKKSHNKLDIATFDKFISLYNPKRAVIDSYWETVSTIKKDFSLHIDDKDIAWWFPLFYSWRRSIEFKHEYEVDTGFKYDYCVKLRPDVLFQQETNLKDYIDIIDNNTFGVNQIWTDTNNIVHTDDIIFISNSKIMDIASTWLKHWIASREHKTGKPLPSFYNFIKDNVKAEPRDLELHYLSHEPTSIALYREDCDIFDPITEFKKCQEGDRFLFHTLRETELRHISATEFEKFRTHSMNRSHFFPNKKMKIAICFSGMIRTGIVAAPFIKRFIGDLYDSVDFFMHTWDISEDKMWHIESRAVMSGKIQQPIIESGYELAEQLNTVYDNKFIDVSIEQIGSWYNRFQNEYINFSPQWYSWYKSINLKKHFELTKKFEYDIVLKMRPDIIYSPGIKLRDEINRCLANKSVFYALGYSPTRIDDVFFMGASDVMSAASKFFVTTDKRAWEENIFGEYLHDVGIKAANTQNTLYAVLRPEALQHDINNFNLCFNIDREYYSPYTSNQLPI